MDAAIIGVTFQQIFRIFISPELVRKQLRLDGKQPTESIWSLPRYRLLSCLTQLPKFAIRHVVKEL